LLCILSARTCFASLTSGATMRLNHLDLHAPDVGAKTDFFVNAFGFVV
jgi:hypothetical protein